MTEKRKEQKSYSSIGAALVQSDFTYIFTELNKWVELDDSNYKGLFQRLGTSEGHIGIGMVIDSLLLSVPKYAINPETKELYPMVKEVVELFVSIGADPSLLYYKSFYGDYVTNMVLESSKLPNSDLLEFLYEKNFWNEAKDIETDSGLDVLQFATTADSAQCIEYLVKEQGFDVNKRYFFSNDATPLFFAIGRCCENSFDKLIELGANIKLKDYSGAESIGYLATQSVQFEDLYQNNDEMKQK